PSGVPLTSSKALPSGNRRSFCWSKRWPWPGGSRRQRRPAATSSPGSGPRRRNSGRRVTFASARRRWAPRGGRWPVTTSAPPGAPRGLAGTAPPAGVRARMGVIDAEVAFAADDLDQARLFAEGALAAEGSTPDVRCHALELIGRSHRLRDLSAARAAFESALVTAEAADLPLWRLRALHELGTIDPPDHAGGGRLAQARGAARQMGALGTVGHP